MVNKLKLLWTLMKGNRMLYLGAVLSIGISTGLSLIPPLVIRSTLDSVIGGQPLDLPPIILSIVEELGGRDSLSRNLWACSLVLVFVTLINGIFLYTKGKWSAQASESTARNMRERLYEHLQSLPYNYHVSAETGDLIQRCTSDVETIRRFLAMQFIEIGRAVFMLAMALMVMISLSPDMTRVSMIVVPVIFIMAVVFFIKIKKTFQASDEAEGRMSTTLQENLTGVRVVRAFGRQAYESEKFGKRNRDYRDLTYRLIRLLAVYWASSDMLIMLQGGTVLIIGVIWAAAGTISLGTLVVFISYESMLLWPIRQMGRILADMGKAFVSLGRIYEILSKPVEDRGEKLLKPEVYGNIEFNNVGFRYDDGSYVLKDLSFSIKKGQTVAILGPTGSGKSSLVHLLQRLYDYQEGSLKIDGVELKAIDRKWIRKHVGIVLQEPFLYSKTIKENIALTRADAEDSKIYEAAGIASVHEVIEEFEQGYDTPVGERGVTLSGGQKQRVAMARTLVPDSPILIFDDSLSAVDTETDARIRERLKERSRDVTTIIISHRVTTLSEADLILVLDHGRLIQSGTHEQLVSQPGLYQRVWSIQNSLELEFKDEDCGDQDLSAC